MADGFMDKAAKEGRAPATMEKNEWLLGMANADFGRKPIADITAPMILRCLKKVEAKGNYETAKRLRSKIGAVFRYAVANGIADNDPTYALRDALIRPTVTPRAAITDPTALGGLLRAIDGVRGPGDDADRLATSGDPCPASGRTAPCQMGRVRLRRRDLVDPAERMKMRRPHRVPLPAQALALLDELRPITGNGVYLFPSLRSVQRPMSENTLNGALRRMGYSAATK